MEKKHTRSQRGEQRAADDVREFRAAVRDVKPLEQTAMAAGLAKPKPRVRLRRPAPAAQDLDEMMPLIASGADAGASNGEPAMSAALSFQRAGVRTQVMRRLRRGLFPVEDELDLHGLNQAAARDRLAEFIVRARDSGHRCIRVIHGKGYRSGARGPVLKTAVDLWLRRHIDVLAFSSARAIDGGTGALYVLLRA
jgi:DNA-nicking Smr family endonuclease